MERVTTNSRIFTYLNRLEDQLIIANRTGENGMAKACESLVRELFSIIHGKKFKNTNLKISNYPVVDLELPGERLAIQVTSTKHNLKLTDCFDKFFKNGLQKDYDRIIIVVLGTKRYKFDILEPQYERIRKKYNVSFQVNFENDLIELSKLYTFISQECSAEKVDQILTLLIRYFQEFKEIKSLVPYYQKLRENFFEVVMDDPKGLTLDSIYVEPAFQIHRHSANPDSNDLEAKGDAFEVIKDLSIHEFLNARLASDSRFDHLVAHPQARLTFILGYPGQGKTSLCSKLLFDQLTLPREKNIFYIKLRNVSDTQSLIHNPFNVIAGELENQLDRDFSKSMLKNSTTILDGLDELYMKDNLTANDIEIFCKDLMREIEKYKDWHVIVTTRHGYINFERLYRESFIAIRLKPLNMDRQHQWLDAYHRFYPEALFTKNKLDELYNVKDNKEGPLLELIDQPLLLYIVASLDQEIDVESTKVEIYNRLFDQIIDRRYSKDGQIENLKNLTKIDLRNMLQEIAYLIFISGNEYVTTSELLESEDMEYYIQKIGDNHLSGTLKGILISFYFKERQEDVKQGEPAGIEFFHKSLQEYLTAEKIVSTIFRTFLNKDQYGQYIMKKPSDFLIKLNETFGRMQISYEIQSDIRQLLAKRSPAEKKELGQRLMTALEYLFEKDFIYKVEPEEKYPMTKGIATFLAFWDLIQYLDTGENFMRSKLIVNRYVSYYQYILSADEFGMPNHLISNQHFSGADIRDWHLMEEEVLNVSFDRCEINTFFCYDSRLEGILFENSEIEEFTIEDCKVKNVKLNSCHIGKMKISRLNAKIIFENCEFRTKIDFQEPIKKSSVIFKKCSFHEQIDTKGLNKAQFIDCVIRKYIFKNKKHAVVDFPIADS